MLGAVFAERFNLTFRDLLEKPVFERGDVKWVDTIPTITKQYNDRIHSSSKLKPKQASLKQNETFFHHILIDKRSKIKLKLETHDLVRTNNLKKTFSKRDSANWSHILNKNTEINKDTTPSYKIYQLSKRHNEALLRKKTQLTLKEKATVMEKQKIIT